MEVMQEKLHEEWAFKARKIPLEHHLQDATLTQLRATNLGLIIYAIKNKLINCLYLNEREDIAR